MRTFLVALLTLALLLCRSALAQSVSDAFTYQGSFTSAGLPAEGTYDFRFSLYFTDTGGVSDVPTVSVNAVPVHNGLFSALVDFGAAFTSVPRFLEIAVSPAGQNTFTTLAPRQRITPAPSATAIGDLVFQAGSSTLDQVQTNTGSQSSMSSGSILTQSFIPSVAGNLLSLDLAVFASGSPRTFTVDILDGPSLVGTGAGRTSSFSATFNPVTLSPAPLLNAGQVYTIRLTTSFAGLSANTSVGNAYPPGALAINGTTQANDLAFQTHMGQVRGLLSTSPLSLTSQVIGVPALRLAGPGISSLSFGGTLFIGSEVSSNLALDAGNLQARLASVPGSLVLNPLGGNVGIGVGSPVARLQIGGVSGTDGIQFPDATLQTTAYQRLKVSGVFDPSSLPAGFSTNLTFFVPGAAVGDVAIANPRVALPIGLVISQTRVNSGAVVVSLLNTSAGAIDAPSNTMDVVVLK